MSGEVIIATICWRGWPWNRPTVDDSDGDGWKHVGTRPDLRGWQWVSTFEKPPRACPTSVITATFEKRSASSAPEERK